MEYEKLKLLYEGNDGPVYLVKENATGQKWVAKHYRYDPTDMDGIDPSVLVEILALNNLKNEKNIVKFHSAAFKKDVVELIVEALDGEISDLILEEPSPAQVRDYFKQMLNGLVKVHEHGMIHNDLKTKNILYRRVGGRVEVKIIDFGLVYLINFPYYRAGRIQTTHHYTPPEYRDHKNLGRISVNSDMFSLGVIFYYFLNPKHYRIMDHNNDYDYVFDPSVVNWKVVQEKGGKHAVNLLRRMLVTNPDDRITSQEALDHPYFGSGGNGGNGSRSRSRNRNRGGRSKSRSKSRRGSRSKSRARSKSRRGRQTGGSRRGRWELPRILSSDEFQQPVNELKFLPKIIERSIRTPSKINPKQKVPGHIWNVLYGYFIHYRLKFVTLNYAICLLQQYLEVKKVKEINWEEVAVACLFISIKLNEYKSVGLSSFEEDPKIILKFEADIVQSLNWELDVPVLLTKEAILYQKYFQLIYKENAPGDSIKATMGKGLGRYHQFYLIQLLSSLFYLSPELANANKTEQCKVVLSFFFKIKHSAELREKVIRLLKSRKVFWMEKSLLEELGL